MRWNTLRGDAVRINALADLLLAAAFADAEYNTDETVAVTATLMKALGVIELPQAVRDHINGFTIDKIDLVSVIHTIGPESEDDGRRLLKLVAKVIRADAVIHPGEDVYIRKVAAELGLDGEVDELLAG